MRYYSTNGHAPQASLSEAVIKGLAADKGLYMPEQIMPLPATFFNNLVDTPFHEMATAVASRFFGDDMPAEDLERIVKETLNFEVPLVPVTDRIFSLELFHGPTLAFKDVGARFMARLLGYFVSRSDDRRTVNVLVATSGDTGSAVANGFVGVEGVRVFVLYPAGKVSPLQEAQFTTMGQNITALRVNGTFDDCQAMVKAAFADAALNEQYLLTSANSINVARFLPQAFYYFKAYAEMQQYGRSQNLVCCVPSGNFGNITAGLIAQRLGLPIKRFIATNNRNDVFYQYLKTGRYEAKPSIATIANAMDVGDPSNFARILDLFGGSHEYIRSIISGETYTDEQIADTIRQTLERTGYLLDPHGACAYRALQENLRSDENGFFLETAHPAKFKETVESIIEREVEVPTTLAAFATREKKFIEIGKTLNDLKRVLKES